MTTKPFANILLPVIVDEQKLRDSLIQLCEADHALWFHGIVKTTISPTMASDLRQDQHKICYLAPFVEGCSVTVRVEDPDRECDEIKLVNIDVAAIKRGLRLIAAQMPGEARKLIQGDGDADTVDMLWQYVVYGEVVYG